MIINSVQVESDAGLTTEEINAYINHIKNKHPRREIEYIKVHVDGDYVALEYQLKPISFRRFRRITGYLGEVKRWNNAKQAELKDRVKHYGGK